MAKPKPDYRTDVLACPLNQGKLAQVIDLVLAMRRCAGGEASIQWRQFFQGGWSGFEATARARWTRPWVKDATLTVSHAQMVMSQVAGSLQGYLGNVQNTFTELVAGSTLPPHIRHQLHFINRKQAWFWPCPVALSQAVNEINPKTGRTHEGFRKMIVPDEVRALARTLIRKAMRLHRKPHFRYFQPQIDQRSCLVQGARQAQHGLWLNLGTRTPGKRIDLPLQAHPGFLARQAKIQAHATPILPPKHETPQDDVSQTMGELPATRKPKSRNTSPAPFVLAKTVRLILAEDRKSLMVAVATDMREAFEHSRNAYTPKTPVLALDLGLCTFLATDQGDLLGRDWIRKLSSIDKVLTGIARHRQALGLPVRSERYLHHVNRLRGYLKTEVNRIFNRLVETKAPAHLILEAVDFSNAKMSRRLNRLIRNFGKGLIAGKLADLEKQYGITHEFRNPAYTSKQCSSCGYTDDRNRPTQTQFHCQFCKQKCHADVNAARTLRDRRSIASIGSRSRYRVKTTLIEQARLFNARFTRPRGRPTDPRLSNPYFKGWPDGVRSPEAATLPSSPCALA